MKKRKGFTILEVVTTMAIIAIVAAACLPVVSNYIVQAAQRVRNENARTLFMASQTALTNLYASGQTQTPAGFVDLTAITPAVAEQELAQNRHHIGYLRLALGEDEPEQNDLYRLIFSYTADKTILQGAILLEYNTLNGNVLTLFYSDETANLGYEGAAYDVRRRDDATLRANRTGYYGVEGTGFTDAKAAIGEINAQLVDYTGDPAGNNINGGYNYGLLTLECQLPSLRAEKDSYDILLKPATGMETTLRFTEKRQAGGDDLSLEDIAANLTLENALSHPFEQILPDGSIRKLIAYIEKQGQTEILVLVLDCPYPGLGIAENYPTIQPGALLASFTVNKGAVSKTANSQKCHAYFADENKENDTLTYQVASVRHLNNIRYKAAADFVQTKDIRVSDYQGKPLLWQPLTDMANQNDLGFKGSYTGLYQDQNGEKTASVIADLTVNSEKAGLFAVIAEKGRVEQVKLSYTDDYRKAYQQAESGKQKQFYINGEVLAGGIAAENNGEIQACTVQGKVRTSDTGSTAGGVAGKNSAKAMIKGCMSAADVTAGENAGGIVGFSAGEITYCETATACALNEKGEPYLAGTPYFGAGEEDSEYRPDGAEVENNLFTIQAKDEDGHAGGIIGYTEQGDIRYCVNAAQVSAARSGFAGGITGIGEDGGAKIALSYNAGDIHGGKAAGGIAGQNGGEISNCYNTGLINARSEYGKFHPEDLAPVYRFSQDLAPDARSGGVAGINQGRLYDSYNAQYVGNIYGGVVGVNQGEIGQCVFLKNMHNRTAAVKTSAAATAQPIAGVQMLDADALRAQTLGALLPNDQQGGVGAYHYLYPYIWGDTDACQLGSAFHRTPYQPVVADTARIRIEQSASGALAVHFLFRGEQADLTLETDAGSLRFPIYREAVEKALFNAYEYGDAYQPNLWWQSDQGGACDGYAVKLNENSPDYDDGYRYEFVLLTDWNSRENDYVSLPDGASQCTGYLYDYEESQIPDAIALAFSNTVERITPADWVLVEPSGEKTVQVSFFLPQEVRTYDPANPGVRDIRFTILYEKGGKTQTLSLSPADLAAYQTDDLQDALNHAGIINPEHGSSARYPFYLRKTSAYPGYDQYTMVLLWDDIGNEGYNGLQAGAFRVQVSYTDWDGKSYEYESKLFSGVRK